jgi:hypothetical protein
MIADFFTEENAPCLLLAGAGETAEIFDADVADYAEKFLDTDLNRFTLFCSAWCSQQRVFSPLGVRYPFCFAHRIPNDTGSFHKPSKKHGFLK